MTITPAQVADLQPGDVVELRLAEETTVRGPLVNYYGSDLGIAAAGWPIRTSGGSVSPSLEGVKATLTVVSRAPRPLYVNHPRTEPVPGDVVRDADRADSVVSWSRAVGSLGNEGWRHTGSANHWRSSMPARLRLLVDGETGQVVP